MAESSEKIVMADPPLIAQHSLQWNIILDIPEDQQEVNGVEEENWTLQFPFMAYSPIPPNEKLEISLDEHQEENNVEEKKWTHQIPKGSVTSTGNTNSTVSGLEIGLPNASLLFGGKTEQRTEMTGELFDSEEEGSEYDERSEKSEHSSLQAFEEPENSLAADSTEEDENVVAVSPKAGRSNEPTRHRQKKSPVIRRDQQFKCDQCGRSYKQKKDLKRHLVYKCGKQPASFP